MLTIRLFGHARLEIDGVARPLRIPPKAVQALAYLVTHFESPVSRDFLAGLLWPDAMPDDGRANLRRHLHLLVRALPEADAGTQYLVTTMQTVRWNDRSGVAVDANAFVLAIADGRSDEATVLYGGDFLEGHTDDWVLGQRERLRNLHIEQLRSSVRQKRSERDLVGALTDVSRILSVDPWREDVIRIEMLLRTQLGDRAGALSAYRNFEQRLGEELDAEPTPETQAMFDAIARDRLPLDADSEPTPAIHEPRGQAATTLPFVGRQVEFGTLTAAWASAARGTGSTVLISGEAGAGKSRLSYELSLHVEGQGGGVLLGTTTYGEEQPYEVVVDALRNALSLLIPLRTPAQLGILSRILPEISARTGIEETAASSPAAERSRIFEAVYSALRALSQKRPLLVVLEDLHWATASTIALVEFLARRVHTLPVLIVATYREEEIGRGHPLRGSRRQMESEGVVDRIALARFDRTTVAQIARHFSNEHEDVEAATTRLFEYSEGVPLFLDEAVHGDTRGAPGLQLNVPARVERLRESTVSILEIAAVAGTGFNIDLLCEVAGWGEAEVLQALDELVEGRFVRQGKRRRFGDYSFSHHLVHRAVYEAIPQSACRLRHALIACASQSLYAGRPDRAAEIASHYDRGGDPARAATAYAAAASHALQLFANEEALAHAERALALATSPQLGVEMQILRAWAAQSLGRPDIAAQSLHALDALPLPRERVPEVERLKTINALNEGNLDLAERSGRRFLRASLANHDIFNTFQAYVENIAVAIAYERYEDAQEQIRRASTRLPPTDETAALRLMRMKTHLTQRSGLDSERLAEDAQWLLAESRRLGDVRTEAEAHIRLAHVALSGERFAEAFACYDAAREAYRRFGSPRGVSTIDINAGNVALWSADYEAARNFYGRCLAFAVENNAQANRLVSAIGLTLADIYTSRFQEGSVTIQSVADLARGRQTIDEANWNLCCALIGAESGDAVGAAHFYDCALAIHRRKPPGALYALTVAFAALTSLDAHDEARSRALGVELQRVPEEFLDGEEFPHMMLWAKSRLAAAYCNGDDRNALLAASARLYEARIRPIGSGVDAYAAVPWNVRFLAELSL